ncbi:unnamed protein product [Enterobius vermicularis]|uniref:Ovule protein n=1 Tax=Enterobius vermicularis TaxID=51028 RepID=A0A0N4V964_ENTVE|nr:unnamed protein product [Enterobius vermicularis]
MFFSEDEPTAEEAKCERDYKALWKWAYEEVCRVHSIRVSQVFSYFSTFLHYLPNFASMKNVTIDARFKIDWFIICMLLCHIQHKEESTH